MDAEEAEEISAEGESAPLSMTLHQMFIACLEAYGWLILFGSLVAIFLYKKVVAPKLKAIAEAKEISDRKKYDMDVHAAQEAKVKAAREKLQHKYALDVEREKEKQEQKRLDELNRAAEEIGLQKPSNKEKPKPINAEEFVMNLINSIPVVLFGKTLCPYSRNAKQALSSYRLPDTFYKIIDLDTLGPENCSNIQDFLQKITGARSVPRVFIGGKCIGGGDDTVAAHRSGRLLQLLTEVRSG